MQTFLPSEDFNTCAQVLDNKRLNKQHLECFQIINVLEGQTTAWANHPAVRMWVGYTDALKYYANCMKSECLSRGFRSEKIPFYQIPSSFKFPKWLGDSLVHISHRSNLARKLYSHYSQFGYIDHGITGYYWPVLPKSKKCQEVNLEWISKISYLKNIEVENV